LVDKRLHARVPIDATLVCEQAGGASLAVYAKDISVGGMYLDSSEQPPAFGANVTIVGLLPGAKKELRLPAVVRWTKPGGFGVQFGLLGAMETHVISELMKNR
jgi:hypothetical protein